MGRFCLAPHLLTNFRKEIIALCYYQGVIIKLSQFEKSLIAQHYSGYSDIAQLVFM